MNSELECLVSLSTKLGSLLRKKTLTLALAESCTGGLISALITEVPGSSAYFDSGLVTYANKAKMELLGVPEVVLTRHGAVSRECVQAMAKGLQKRRSVDLALSVTGIAGPGGGSEEKPVGTVHIGLATSAGVTSRLHVFKGSRAEVRAQTAEAALQWLNDVALNWLEEEKSQE